MARIRDGVAKVAAAGVLGDLTDRRLAQRGRAGLLEFVAHQLDDPQQLVADARMRRREPGQLLEAAVAPDPAVQASGMLAQAPTATKKTQSGASPACPRRDRGEQARYATRTPKAAAATASTDLDRPDPAAKLVQLLLERSRQLEPIWSVGGSY